MNNCIDIDRASAGAAAAHSPRVYASPRDFCAIFDEDMSSLYSLALLLTGSHETAQECFLSALEDCRTGRAVFAEWARSWSRRAVIKSAIRLLAPALAASAKASEAGRELSMGDLDAAARAVLELGSFERFVFVITVLEGYAIRECAALLGCSPREVQVAQVRALQEIAGDTRDVLPPYEDGVHTYQDPVTALH